MAAPDFLQPVLPVKSRVDSVDMNDAGLDSMHSVTRVSVADDPLSMFAAPPVTTTYERAGQLAVL